MRFAPCSSRRLMRTAAVVIAALPSISTACWSDAERLYGVSSHLLYAVARADFTKALQIDSGFAPAYNGRCATLTLKGDYDAAIADCSKAIELNPRLAEAHAALGLVQTFWEWDWAAADRSFQQALALNAGNAEIHQYYSQHLSAAGRFAEAIAEARRALEMDPLSPRLSGQYARVLYLARRSDDAIAQHRKTLALDPNDYWAWFFMGIAYESKGLHREAIDAIAKSQEIQGYKPLAAALREGYLRAGYEGALLAWVANWEEGARQGRQVQWVSVAMLHARLGDREKALAALEKAYQERSRALAYIGVEPQLDALRSEPRFQEMARAVAGGRTPAL